MAGTFTAFCQLHGNWIEEMPVLFATGIVKVKCVPV